MAPHGPSDPQRADFEGQVASRPVSSPSILVVDGDPGVLDALDRALRDAGASVTAVPDGRAALQAIAGGHCRPTLLLTEIELPGMTGIELAARVSALRPGITVVMMTGDAHRAAAARDRPGLVTRVILKPVVIGELLDAMGLVPAEPR